MSDVILVGGSQDGTVTPAASGMQRVNSINLKEDLSAPEYVDLYLPTGHTNKADQEIYVHVGRYDEEESASYWEQLDKDEKEQLVEQTKAQREAEAKAAEDAEKQKLLDELLAEKEAKEAKEKEDAEKAAEAAKAEADKVEEVKPDASAGDNAEAPSEEAKPEGSTEPVGEPSNGE